MASLKHMVVASAVFFTFLLFSPRPVDATSSRLVDRVCNGDAVTDHAFCLKALSSPSATSAKSPKDLMKVVMKLATTDGEATTKEINSAIASKNKDPAAVAALKQCLNSFSAVINSFSLVVKEMEEDPLSASYDSKVTGDQVGQCETALASAHVDLPKIAAGNQAMENYIAILFEVANEG